MTCLARPVGLALLLIVLLATPARAAGATEVTLQLRPDGVLHVVEKGAQSRAVITRTRFDDASDRVFLLTGVKGAAFDGETLTVPAAGTVEYDVTGAVTQLPDGTEELRWSAAGGPLDTVKVTVRGPGQIQGLTCFAGPATSAIGCTAAGMDESAENATFEQTGLAEGEQLTIVVAYPAGSTGAQPILENRFDLATAFTVDMWTGGSLIVLLILLLGGLYGLYRSRGRDARVVESESGLYAPLENGRFAPPDGVRPGQIGTLIDEQADVIDVTATIVDLAVRGYLRIDEQPRGTYDAPDWLLVKLPDTPLQDLLPYERALHDAMFDIRDDILLSQLHGGFSAGLARVRDALYRDVVKQGWFARRPDSTRSRWTVLGILLTIAGVAGTLMLAWTTTYGLVGLAVIIAGAALTVGGQFMPAKTAKGAGALAHTLGFRQYLISGDVNGVPEEQRIELFSRYLPYAVIFDSVDRWARVVSTITTDGDNLYWYHGPAEWDLSKFADSMRTFVMTTSGAISAARQFRSF
ncbi:DUF2207 domain-containing protein [Herbidospora mongoliensis]|uniref:DUF2207 domain-containing protein n=1 Tax=Herbidospora mongoliensis TaxID=688067 RepID=UPI000A037271|nr:DUF2207 domain-containing protein [Herbidospora mongoliensis]